MEYKFRIPIGDWSDDGHGKYKDYLIKSNKPLELVRELYFQACDKLGFSLDGSYKEKKLTPASNYEDYSFKKDTLQALLDFGIKLSEEDIEYIKEQESTDGTELFCDIVLRFIETQDSELKLERIPDENFPMFQFYGFDEKKRHIGYFGYGLFNQ
jgi:hypothetical protein